MTIYLLTFYLFDDIEKNIEITHANHPATSKTILTKMLVQFATCVLRTELSMMIVVTEKPKNNCFIQVKPFFFGR